MNKVIMNLTLYLAIKNPNYNWHSLSIEKPSTIVRDARITMLGCFTTLNLISQLHY